MKIARRWTERPSPLGNNCRLFTWGYCRVLIEHHGEPHGWHLSISCAHRYPTWEEIKAARYDLLPRDITMAMLLPPPDEYVNVHPNCFHLHQIEDAHERQI
jgi:hypothetical protein